MTLKLDYVLVKLPEVVAGKNIWQNKYHSHDVFGHSMAVVRNIRNFTKDENMIAAAYLHDIGKPVVAKPLYNQRALQEKEPGKQYHRFLFHEAKGAEMVRDMNHELFKDLKLDQEKITKLVAYHFAPMIGIKTMRRKKTLEEFLGVVGCLEFNLECDSKVTKEEILTIFLADSMEKSDKEELIWIRNTLLETELEKKTKNLREIFEYHQRTYK